jgi:glutathione S-transferase
VSLPLLWQYSFSDFNEEAAERSRATVVAALDRIESERGGGEFLGGDPFTVADIAAAALLYRLAWPPQYPYELPEPPSEFLDSVLEHPAVGWIGDTYRRHRGRSAAVA